MGNPISDSVQAGFFLPLFPFTKYCASRGLTVPSAMRRLMMARLPVAPQLEAVGVGQNEDPLPFVFGTNVTSGKAISFASISEGPKVGKYKVQSEGFESTGVLH